jgi:hypothetical protein
MYCVEANIFAVGVSPCEALYCKRIAICDEKLRNGS